MSDYIKLATVDPWGEDRDDLRQAIHTLSVVQALAQVNSTLQSIAARKRVKAPKFNLEQFHLGLILRYGKGGKGKKRQTQNEMLAIVRALAGATKAKILKPMEGMNPQLDLYGGPAIKPQDPNYKGRG